MMIGKIKQPWKLWSLLLIATTLLAIPVLADEEKKLNIIALTLDIVMISIGIISVYYAWNILKGAIGQGLKIASIGLAIFGFFHLLATVLPLFTDIPGNVNQTLHRVLGVIAFSFIAFGLNKIRLTIKMVYDYYSKERK